MLIVASEHIALPSLFRYLSHNLSRILVGVPMDSLEEIRIRLSKPVVLHYTQKIMFLDKDGGMTGDKGRAYIAQKSDLTECVEKLSHGSVYAYQNEIQNGYITTQEGDRVGISGHIVMDGDSVGTIREIASLNFRFSREIIGAADMLMPYILPPDGPKSVLLLSPPQCGKTTMLRDAARQIAMHHKTVIIDERCELAGVSGGICHYDLGLHSEVLSGCPKDIGMMMALRSLSPQFMVTDELGRTEDVEAVRQALNCGVTILASMHATNISDLKRKRGLEDLYGLFDVVACLGLLNGKRVLTQVEKPCEKS
jgi:Uncharacterized protein conserved in bacteria